MDGKIRRLEKRNEWKERKERKRNIIIKGLNVEEGERREDKKNNGKNKSGEGKIEKILGVQLCFRRFPVDGFSGKWWSK